MTETCSAILSSIALGEKSRLQIASELNVPPSKVAGALASLVYAGQIVVSGKIKQHGKHVSVYAVPSRQPAKRETVRAPVKPQADETSVSLSHSNLYQIWGGYAKVDKQLSQKLTIRKHVES